MIRSMNTFRCIVSETLLMTIQVYKALETCSSKRKRKSGVDSEDEVCQMKKLLRHHFVFPDAF